MNQQTVKPAAVTAQILFSGLGGHGSVVFSMIEADKDKVLNNNLIFYGNEELKPEYAERCIELNIPYAFVKKLPGLHLNAFRRVYLSLKKTRPEVLLLHSHSIVVLALIYGLLNRCKIVMIEHNSNQTKKKIEWLWSLIGLVFCSRVIYLTDEYRKEIRRKFGFLVSKRKVKIIPNGIDTELYAPAPMKERDASEVIRLSMIARFSFHRDHKSLTEAFYLITKQFPDLSLELTLAGDGQKLEEVRSLAIGIGLKDQIKFPGSLSESQIVPLLQSSDLYVHSTLSETMSTSVMQALSCGLPVIASDIPSIRSLVPEGCGILFPCGDKISLAREMGRLINDPGLCQYLSANARKHAVKNLSSIAMFDKYYSLVQSLRKN